MECVSITESEKEDIVVGEVRPAYFMGGLVIRTAQVIVSKVKKTDESHPHENEELKQKDQEKNN